MATLALWRGDALEVSCEPLSPRKGSWLPARTCQMAQTGRARLGTLCRMHMGITIEQVWSAALGALALTSTHLAGSRRSSAWVVGMVSQVGWLGFIILTGNFGFLVSFTGFTFVYIRNYIKWTRKAAPAPSSPPAHEPCRGECRLASDPAVA